MYINMSCVHYYVCTFPALDLQSSLVKATAHSISNCNLAHVKTGRSYCTLYEYTVPPALTAWGFANLKLEPKGLLPFRPRPLVVYKYYTHVHLNFKRSAPFGRVARSKKSVYFCVKPVCKIRGFSSKSHG